MFNISLLNVPSTQPLVASADCALTAVQQVQHYQQVAGYHGWEDGRIEVQQMPNGPMWAYRTYELVNLDIFEQDWFEALPEAGPCPAAPALPWGWDQVDEADPTWTRRGEY